MQDWTVFFQTFKPCVTQKALLSVQMNDIMKEKMVDTSSEIVLVDGTMIFRLTFCFLAQWAWNETVKRTEHSSCMMSIKYKTLARSTKSGSMTMMKQSLQDYAPCTMIFKRSEAIIQDQANEYRMNGSIVIAKMRLLSDKRSHIFLPYCAWFTFPYLI